MCIVLQAIEGVSGEAGYRFTLNGAALLKGYHKGRNYIANRMIVLASEERGENVQIPHWTFHDLRRTAALTMTGGVWGRYACSGKYPRVSVGHSVAISCQNHQCSWLRWLACLRRSW